MLKIHGGPATAYLIEGERGEIVESYESMWDAINHAKTGVRQGEAYELHELACNIAEDFDGGAIHHWRLAEVKECLRAGGTTALDDEGELELVWPEGYTRTTQFLSATLEEEAA